MIDVNRDAALQRLRTDLEQYPEILDACTRAVLYLAEQPAQALSRISFGLLSKAAGVATHADALPVADYLSSARLHLLEKQYVLIVGDDEYDITPSELSEATKQNVLIHPDLGEPVADFDRHIYLYFKPSTIGSEVFKTAE